MLAIVEAMTAYDVPRERIKVLSIGFGDEPYQVTRRMTWGGLWHWRKIIGAAMRGQSLAATNQARLLLGPTNVVRIGPTLVRPPIELDDCRRAMDNCCRPYRPPSRRTATACWKCFWRRRPNASSPCREHLDRDRASRIADAD